MHHKNTLFTPALILLIAGFFGFTSFLYARENNKPSPKKTAPPSRPGILAVCGNPTAQTDLEVNNVRFKIQTAGDMWWDYVTQVGRYEVPKDSKKYSIYAGALWIGGIDQGGQLKVAAQEYGHNGGNNDFWPGPLDLSTATVNDVVCKKYDKHFRISRKEVEDFAKGLIPATQAIKDWPGNGDVGQAQYLAPFFDGDQDGKYDPGKTFVDPADGKTKPYDYPGFDLTGIGCVSTDCIPNDQLYGDELLWWVFNDKGDIHGETGGQAIGLEIHGQAFGFSTNDEVNNMTFYSYRIYNRSTTQLDSCYFGVWCDADLGYAGDDYVGCDVSRGLGYTYNGDNNDDEASQGYGLNPPAVGVDFFQGPITNPKGVPGDGIDNNRNCKVDEECEQAIMSKFVYFTNGGGFPQQDPANAVQYYNYLSGKWQNGARWTYGGTGIGGTTFCDFCFPDKSDHKYEWGTGGNCQKPGLPQADWNEVIIGAVPNDRRMMQSAGPFRLLPGAVNVITTGVVWARATSGGATASVNLLKFADSKAQALFDNCFKITNGPDAPELTIQELDKKLYVFLTNGIGSNNYNEKYPFIDKEKDPYITSGTDTVWKFQGYKLYQLKNASVSSAELDDADKARLVGIYDLKDGVKQIVNYYIGASPNPNYWTPKEMVNAPDNGIQHSVVITKDLFSTGDPTLINHKTYYFMAIAYAYNPGEIAPDPSAPSNGFNLPYLAGRRNIKAYSAIPHIVTPYTGGTEMHSDYGDGPMITRIEGNGNGGTELEFTTSTVASILASPDSRIKTPEYDFGKGPVRVRVVDPLNVPDENEFTLKFDNDNIANSTWTLINNTTAESVKSDRTIKTLNEQLVLQWGLAVSIVQVTDPGLSISPNNGLISGSMTFDDPTKHWLNGLADKDGPGYTNWIRSGSVALATTAATASFENDYVGVDANQDYEKVIGGTWAPYRLCAATEPPTVLDIKKYYTGPGFRLSLMSQVFMKELASVDVVITSDKSKWSRCVVFEMCEDSTWSANTASFPKKARKFDFRRAASVDKNGSTAPGPDNNDFSTGMGWFPGYAINLETGERLNIAFGENSALVKENGNDMKWNPTANETAKNYNLPWDSAGQAFGSPVFGGQHYIYVFGHNKDNDPTSLTLTPNDTVNVPRYDGGKRMREILGWDKGLPVDVKKRELFRDGMWTNIPLLAASHNLFESDVTIRLRVAKRYRKKYSSAYWVDALDTFYADSAAVAGGQNNNLPLYTFKTTGIATHTQETELAVDALSQIRVVPNPYYAYSNYENTNLDNGVKITNLPEVCTVSIYNLGGTLIRRFKKQDPIEKLHPKEYTDLPAGHDGSLDWDLKNTVGIPISSGVYIIHVEVPGVGERTVKWFGVMRPIDLGTF
jgi:hypothetical protein